jgi:hypothetical protein
MTTKRAMLPHDILAIEMISLVAGGHGRTQQPKLSLQTFLVEEGFARTMVAIVA